jgi:predicted Na+-dependent transporter
MATVKDTLLQNKTIITAILAIISTIIGYLTNEISMVTAIQSIFVALGAIFLRTGITTTVNKAVENITAPTTPTASSGTKTEELKQTASDIIDAALGRTKN